MNNGETKPSGSQGSENTEVKDTVAIDEGESHSTSTEYESSEVSKVQNAEEKEETVEESKSLLE